MAGSRFFDKSFLLQIPTELRFQIYNYCLEDANTITITAAPVTSASASKLLERQSNIPGLPRNYHPLVKLSYDPNLLSIATPVNIKLDDVAQSKMVEKLPHSPSLALLQTCRLIHDELSDYMRSHQPSAHSGLALYVTYPYGILVLEAQYPFLYLQAKHVYICGYYPPSQKAQAERRKRTYYTTPEVASTHEAEVHGSRHSVRRQNPRLRLRMPDYTPSKLAYLPDHPKETTEHAPKVLASIIRSLLPPTGPRPFRKLELRILYPEISEDSSYSSLWADEKGPVTTTLRNTCGGKIDMEVWRGRLANAVLLTVEPQPDSRLLSSVWKRLGNTREENLGCVIGKHWGQDYQG